MSVPHTVFIIPYRDRAKEKESLDTFLKSLKLDRNWSNDDVKIFYVNQLDNKRFNRGAMKNIGFLHVKKTYPDNYKDITLIFHDVDFHPSTTSLLPYSTQKGKVEHYYGFTHVLGGIFAIKGQDFEKCGGFPNYRGWGFEDNKIYMRCLQSKLDIDRSNWYKIYDKNFIYIENGDKNNKFKQLSKREFYIFKHNEPEFDETFDSIKNLDISIDNDNDMINVHYFDTSRMYHNDEFGYQDLTYGRIKAWPGYFRRNWSFSNTVNATATTQENATAITNEKNTTSSRSWKLF